MSVLNNSNWEAPFWGGKHKVIFGRDPLGFQSSSIATYGKLLPGLTNLTKRIRYYGFYCWLLDHYWSDPSKWKGLGPNDLKWINYIRRSELLLAYLNRINSEVTGIPGSDFVSINTCVDGVIIDLGVSADFSNITKTYWKYKTGAFGQYYVGSLVNQNLIREQDKFYNRTTNGEVLANAYDRNIADDAREQFFKIVLEGKFSLEDIESLSQCFNVEAIESHEADKYIQFLKNNDSGLINIQNKDNFRRQTIEYYLEKLEKKEINELIETPKKIYFEYSGSSNNDLDAAWCYYQLNEYTNYALETLLWGILTILKENVRKSKNYFYDECLEIILTKSEKTTIYSDNNEGQSESHKEMIENSISYIKGNLNHGINDVHATMGKAFYMLFELYRRNNLYIEGLKDVAKKLEIRRGTDCIEFFDYITDNKELGPKNLHQKIIQRFVIELHMIVAYNKMRNTNQNSLKFNKEDGYLWFVNLIEPNNTTPRLDTLQQMLIDLNVLYKDDVGYLMNKDVWGNDID